MTVAELRAALGKRGLDSKGVKGVLQERLEAASLPADADPGACAGTVAASTAQTPALPAEAMHRLLEAQQQAKQKNYPC